jgi:hypothetical protein
LTHSQKVSGKSEPKKVRIAVKVDAAAMLSVLNRGASAAKILMS